MLAWPEDAERAEQRTLAALIAGPPEGWCWRWPQEHAGLEGPRLWMALDIHRLSWRQTGGWHNRLRDQWYKLDRTARGAAPQSRPRDWTFRCLMVPRSGCSARKGAPRPWSHPTCFREEWEDSFFCKRRPPDQSQWANQSVQRRRRRRRHAWQDPRRS